MAIRTISQSIDLKEYTEPIDTYITSIDATGIQIHPKNYTNNNYIQLTGNGLQIFNNNIEISKFEGNKIRIGKTDDNYVEITQNGLYFLNDENEISSFEEDNIRLGKETSIHSIIDINGMHIYTQENNTSIELAKFTANEAVIGQNSNGNVLIDNDSIDIRDGSSVLATFGMNGARIGQNSGSHVFIHQLGIDFFATEGGPIGTISSSVPIIRTIEEELEIPIPYDPDNPWDERGRYCHISKTVSYNTIRISAGVTRYRIRESWVYDEVPYEEATYTYTFEDFDATVTVEVDPESRSVSFEFRDTSGTPGLIGAFGYVFYENVYAPVKTVLGNISDFQEYGEFSVALNSTIAKGDYQTTCGKFNDIDDDDQYAFIIGNGTSDEPSDRSNALTIDWQGRIRNQNGVACSWIAGRDQAKIQFDSMVNGASQMHPYIAMNSYDGNWQISTYSNNALYFMYTTDIDYMDGINRATGAYIATDGTYTKSSDKKIKKNIANLTYAKDLIMNLKPVEFNLKNTDNDRTHMGFIAQDVAQIGKKIKKDLSLYSAIYRDPTKYETEYNYEEIDDNELIWSLAYSELIAPLVQVVQEQQKEIDQLKKLISK